MSVQTYISICERPPCILTTPRTMPALTSGKVLVTGANGYIAAWVIKDFLEHGYAVRGTVRSEGKATYLRDYFKTFGDKFEIAIVPDITKVRPIGPLSFASASLGPPRIMYRTEHSMKLRLV